MSFSEACVDEYYVQFTDDTETVIGSYFCCQQDPNVYPNLGTVFGNDPRYIAYYDSLPAFARDGMPVPIYPTMTIDLDEKK
ncbi:Uncharacterised protein [Yersinia enterocolitica]|nr:Uncharacterised protein [Yersinia enterocolitica]